MTATADIVTLASLKGHLRVDHADDDVGLTSMLEAARRHIEAYVGPLDEFEEVPADIVEAMKRLASQFYDERGTTTEEARSINGTAIEPLVRLYSRLSQAQAELGASSEDLTRFTDGIALALRVGGTNAAAASGALLQLSQAMGGAIVRAEEFNSINEGARPILQAVASGLEEAGGSVSKLRSLVIDGKLSSEAFFRAFLAGMPALQQKASKATGTVGQGVTRLE